MRPCCRDCPARRGRWTSCYVCFPHAFDQRGPLLDQRVPALARAPREAVTWPSAARKVSPSSWSCPACSLRQPFAGVSFGWRGVLFGHNRTRPPPYMGWRGPCSACLTRLASFPAYPASPGRLSTQLAPATQLARLLQPIVGAKHPREVPVSQLFPRPRSCPRVVPVSDDRQGQTPARGAGFPAPPTSPESPPGGARFRR